MYNSGGPGGGIIGEDPCNAADHCLAHRGSDGCDGRSVRLLRCLVRRADGQFNDLNRIQIQGAPSPADVAGVDSFLRWAPSVGAVGSVVVAIAAIWIAIFLHDQQAQQQRAADSARESAERLLQTFHLQNHYGSMETHQSLLVLAHKIIAETNRRYRSEREKLEDAESEMGSGDLEDLFSRIERDVYDDLTSGRDDIEAWLTIFLRASDVVFDCGWDVDGPGLPLCDQKLLFRMYVEDAGWIYFGVRRGLFCNEGIRTRFRESVRNVETMIMAGMRDDGMVVFRTHEERGSETGFVLRPKVSLLCEVS